MKEVYRVLANWISASRALSESLNDFLIFFSLYKILSQNSHQLTTNNINFINLITTHLLKSRKANSSSLHLSRFGLSNKYLLLLTLLYNLNEKRQTVRATWLSLRAHVTVSLLAWVELLRILTAVRITIVPLSSPVVSCMNI